MWWKLPWSHTANVFCLVLIYRLWAAEFTNCLNWSWTSIQRWVDSDSDQVWFFISSVCASRCSRSKVRVETRRGRTHRSATLTVSTEPGRRACALMTGQYTITKAALEQDELIDLSQVVACNKRATTAQQFYYSLSVTSCGQKIKWQHKH